MADILIRGISLPEGEFNYTSLWIYGDGRVTFFALSGSDRRDSDE